MKEKLTLLLVLQYLGLFFVSLLGLFLVVYGSFNFIYDNLKCDYVEDGYLYDIYEPEVTYNYIKHVYGFNVSGLYNQNFLIDRSRVVIDNCKFKFENLRS